MTRKMWLAALLLLAPMGAHAQGVATPLPDDRSFDWLETPTDPAAVAWAKERTEHAIKTLLADPESKTVLQEVRDLAKLTSGTPPFVQPYSVLGDKLARFTLSAQHPAGVIEIAPRGPDGVAGPWRAVLDIDALNKAEGQEYGMPVLNLSTTCLPPGYRRCLIPLGIRGSEIVQFRELDLETGKFVPGFDFKVAKTEATWLDEDTLLVAQAVPGDTLKTGFPSTVRLWKRGTPYATAKPVFKADPGDVFFRLTAMGLGKGRKGVISQNHDFVSVDTYLVGLDGSVTPTSLPKTIGYPGNLGASGGTSRYVAMWTTDPVQVDGRTYPEGTVFAYDTADSTPAAGRLSVVYTPPEGEYLFDGQFGAAYDKSSLYFITTRDSTQSLVQASPGPKGWTVKTLRTAPKGNALRLWGGGLGGDTVVLGEGGYLTPSTLSLVDGDHCCTPLKANPAVFDASKFVVETHTATSRDGAQIDYYLVRPRDRKPGPVPTILSAYAGGGGVTQPGYAPRLLDGTALSWFNRGGAYAFAAARGGGDKGRAWYRGGSGLNKGNTLDDVAAVAQDLIKSGFTSPAKLGLTGRSYGGLMASGVAVRYPQLFSAVLVGVPIVDPYPIEGQVAARKIVSADLGDPKDPEVYKAMLSYFALPNVRAGVTYPRILTVGSTSDDRVGPGPARRFTAKLEAAGAKPLLIEGPEGGHIFPSVASNPEAATAEIMFFIETLMR